MSGAFGVLVVMVGGALLLEGAAYTLFPGLMRRAMREAQTLPDRALRFGGLVACVLGLGIVYFMLPQT